jgi:hypothetical protein
MTIKEWKEKYYPLEAKSFSRATWLEAARASLKKYEGLLVVEQSGNDWLAKELSLLHYSPSCSLCWRSSGGREDPTISGSSLVSGPFPQVRCGRCPLLKVTGVSCEDFSSPWSKMIVSKRPLSGSSSLGSYQGMDDALRQTVEYLEQKDAYLKRKRERRGKEKRHGVVA